MDVFKHRGLSFLNGFSDSSSIGLRGFPPYGKGESSQTTTQLAHRQEMQLGSFKQITLSDLDLTARGEACGPQSSMVNNWKINLKKQVGLVQLEQPFSDASGRATNL